MGALVQHSALRGRDGEMSAPRNFKSILITMVFILPMLAAVMPYSVADGQPEEVEEGWWVETSLDRNKDGIGDMVEVALLSEDWPKRDGRIGVIVDFDHLPTSADEALLIREVGFETSFHLPLIHAIAGSIEITGIIDASNLPGVVMIELDGILTVSMDSVVTTHGVDQVWEDTGYTGDGVTVAIIDTGIDANHSGLDDLDDDPTTNDPKVIAFYDAINNPGLTNGTDVEPYDDHGHGTHCGGITAGTGAPDFEFIGVAPQAKLVGVKVLSGSGSGSFAQVMAGMQWTVDNRYQFNIRSASMSLGGPGIIEFTSSEEDSVNRMANEMMRAGIALFIAAGNNAVSAQIGTPGSAEDVITVGALDKDTSIASYSSQGPTEEMRVKPNIAFVGSSVMSAEANSGDGYVAMSGTSMATPGAAGVGALMFQAAPDLSPFDMRNIMQETSTYRECYYMGDPAGMDGCPDPQATLLQPKPRQNNVYGHGHVNAHPAVMEAANRTYGLNTSLTINVTTQMGMDNKIHLSMGDSINLVLSEPVDSVQWRSVHLRDDWASLHEYDHSTSVSISHTQIIDNLEHLPGIDLDGNHTITFRSIKGEEASPLEVVEVMVMGTEKMGDSPSSGGDSGFLMLIMGIGLGLLLALGTYFGARYAGGDDVEFFAPEEEKVAEAELLDNS